MSAEVKRFVVRQFGNNLSEASITFVLSNDCHDDEDIKLACARSLLVGCGLMTESVEIEEYNALLREKEEIRRDLESAHQEAMRARAEADSVAEMATERDNLIKSLESGINRMQGELTDLSGKLSKATSRADALEAEVRSKDKIICEQSARLSAYFVKTDKLERECDDLQDFNGIFQFQRDLHASVANHAVTENIKLQEENRSLRAGYNESRDVRASYAKLIEEKNAEIQSLRGATLEFAHGECVQPEPTLIQNMGSGNVTINIVVNHGVSTSPEVARQVGKALSDRVRSRLDI